MAYVTGKYTAGATGMGTASNHSQPGLWSYAVPPDEDPTASTAAPDSAVDQSAPTASRQPLTAHINGTTRPNPRRYDKTSYSPDPAYSPPSTNLKPPAQIAEQNDISAANSEADSLLDLYQGSGSGTRAKSSSRAPSRVKRKGSLGAVSALSDNNNGNNHEVDVNSKWIHRDKLAQIESRELAELRLSHGGSKSRARLTSKKSSLAPSVDLDNDSTADGDRAAPDSKRMRTVSPTYANEGVLEEEEDFNADPPSPTQHTPRSGPTTHARRPSASKIPITKTNSQGEPSSPTQPSSPNQRMNRTRSGSLSNHNPDTPPTLSTATTNTSAVVSSPTSSQKKKTPSKTTPQSGQRKSSRGAKTGTPSRPGTSGGTSRPSTAKPEGDPPWIATMYKPDPRLPPDQQMLPTHAKRLAQEPEFREAVERGEYYEPPQNSEYTLLDEDGDDANQEIENSSPADEYQQQEEQQQREETFRANGQDEQSHNDQMQDFPPHAVGYYPFNGYPAASSSPTKLEPNQQQGNNQNQARASPTTNNSPREDPQWPLRSPEPTSPQRNFHSDKEVYVHPNGRAGTPGLESGYSLMPPIQNPKEPEQVASQRIGRSNPSPTVNTQQPTQAIRVPDGPEHDEKNGNKKKGCAACCIVM